jgi:hypothetical protein
MQQTVAPQSPIQPSPVPPIPPIRIIIPQTNTHLDPATQHQPSFQTLDIYIKDVVNFY